MSSINSIEIAQRASELLDSKKAVDLKILDITKLTIVADYFVISTGTSAPQLRAMADEVTEKLKAEGIAPLRTEGYQTASWILIDFGAVIVHIFNGETRKFYDLERLWADAALVNAPDEAELVPVPNEI